MDRLISLEPSNTVTIRIEPGQRCFGVLTLRNIMHTMPVAFRVRPVNKARYTVSPQSGIILPLASLTLEITYLPASTQQSNDNNLLEPFSHCDEDSFVLQSVLAPGASIKNPTLAHDSSVPNDWFINKKKQVYTDSGIKIVFVGSRVLTYLVTKGCMDEIREVLERSEPMWKSADSTDIDGQSLLHLAVSQGRADIVQLLLEFGSDVEALNLSGSSPLEAASASGDALIAELLLAHKACPEKSRRSARGPIHLASGNGHVEVLKHLLQKGANVNSLTKDGNTALHLAVEERRRDCARLLLANSARTDVRNSSYGDTPLHVASTLGDEYMVKLLLHKGAYRDIRNKAGKTSYDLAAENGHTKLFDALRLGDDLCAAARKGELRMVLRMLERGASINGRDQKGWTPLHRACFKGRIDVVRVLIDKGVDVNAKDNEGYTALLCAVEAGQVDVIELLLKRGVDVEARTNKGVSALQIAESLQYSGIVRMLSSKHSLISSCNKGYNVSVIKEMDFDVTKKRSVNKSGISLLGGSLERSEPLVVV